MRKEWWVAMRKAIYDHLTNNCTSIKEWLQGYQSNAGTPKPYGVIIIGDQADSVNNHKSGFRELVIWPYFEEGNFIPVDGAVEEIKNLLNKQLITTDSGKQFTVEHVNTGKDFHDTDLKAFTRKMNFRIPILR